MNKQELLEKLEKQPQDIQARFDLTKFYFLNKNFEASLPHCKYLVENCVDRSIDYQAKEAKRLRKK